MCHDSMLETAHTAFLWTWLYQMIVTNFGSILFLNAVPWSLGACLITFCVVGELVEAFFTYRVYILSGHWWLALPFWTLQLSMVLFIVPCIVALAVKSGGLLQFKDRYDWLVYVCLIIATIVSYVLYLHGWTRINGKSFRLTWATRYCYAGI
jgi:hypothetical protein